MKMLKIKNEPVDYNNPLGISKREWTRVLGVNLALLLIVYAVALVCTLTGNDFFLLKFESADLQRIEDTLRGWNIFPIVQMGLSTIEMTLMSIYVAKAKPIWWYTLAYFAMYLGLNVLLTQTTGGVPSWIAFVLTLLFVVGFVFVNWKPKEKWFVYLCRLAIVYAVTFTLNEGISLFRIQVWQIWQVNLSNSALFVLNIEYYLALALALGFLTLLIPWKKKGGKETCPTSQDASGSSPTTKSWSLKNSKIAKTNLPPKIRKRLLWLKIRVVAIQTTALVVIAALPWFTGRPVEFALVYASFCLTRLMLGFNRSLHFKSELSCVTIGALCFWALTFLTPNAETSIILSLCYGGGLALGFRLYWELHDLMMYKKASKTDRYAMFYVVFKGNLDPKHINGVMRAKGITDKDDIKMVQLYMQREKIEYIAWFTTYAKITIEKKLTCLAERLYSTR